MGKSTAVSDLLTQLRTSFDLVICFVGSAACNPVLKMQLELWYDPRFFFSEWNPTLMAHLLEQQENLKRRGVTRNVLILVDDVVLTSKAEDQLSCVVGISTYPSCAAASATRIFRSAAGALAKR